MGLSLVPQRLLVLLSILALTRAQTTQTSADTTTTETATTQTSADTTTAEPATTQTIATTTTTAWTAPAIFYPFGSAAGDIETIETGGETYQYVSFSTPFTYFGRTYNSIYVNNNGLLSFNQPIPEAHPFVIPAYGAEDFIAALWTDLDDFGFGKYWFQQHISGSVLTRATQDINQYFPQMNFSASSVFVATWDYVQTGDMNVFNLRSAPTITFQAVLISGGDFSFILMNYGDCADVVPFPVEAGYDTIGSTDYYVIHYANVGNSISNLKYGGNVDVPGRWVFDVNNGTGTTVGPTTPLTTTTTTTTAWTAPAIFYPFGSAAGDGEQLETGYETFVNFTFSTPFTYFGRKYNYIYVNNNGLLTFNQPIPEAHPLIIPNGAEDFIAALWTELDDFGFGKYWFQQHISGSVLTRASQDINQYFPHIGFTASSVFVVTWDYVQTSDMNVFNLRSAPTITFQAVLISGGGFSFILMNYGDCANAVPYPVEAGYNTINSTDYYVNYYANDGYSISNIKNTSNINVPGRWAFLVNNGTENVLGVQIKLSSFLDLTQTGNIEDVLKQIKQELVNRGASSFFEVKLRNVKKTQP